MSDKLIFVK